MAPMGCAVPGRSPCAVSQSSRKSSPGVVAVSVRFRVTSNGIATFWPDIEVVGRGLWRSRHVRACSWTSVRGHGVSRVFCCCAAERAYLATGDFGEISNRAGGRNSVLAGCTVAWRFRGSVRGVRHVFWVSTGHRPCFKLLARAGRVERYRWWVEEVLALAAEERKVRQPILSRQAPCAHALEHGIELPRQERGGDMVSPWVENGSG